MSPRGPRWRNRLTTADMIAVGVEALALMAGIAVLSLASGTIASSVGLCLLGLSGVAFVALAFLLVGESEDRDYGEGAK